MGWMGAGQRNTAPWWMIWRTTPAAFRWMGGSESTILCLTLLTIFVLLSREVETMAPPQRAAVGDGEGPSRRRGHCSQRHAEDTDWNSLPAGSDQM